MQIQCAKLENTYETAKLFGSKTYKILIFCNFPAKNLHNWKNSCTFAPAKQKQHRGVEQLVARQAHNLEVACSNPASATTTG